ncbi:hypothetical protein IPM65_04380 [Candidatus Roizmanbacteria bacterium]|nr:MAG: hypothetical protein IPM65_04380 [Candidatus Roizmanbacteria bacterium]
MFIFILLCVFWVLYKGIHFLHVFEEKDYRLDRFQAGISDNGFISLFYTYKISLPSVTPRNFMILSFHFLVTGVLFLFAFEDVYVYNLLSYFFWLAPFMAFIIVLTAVVLTQIPVQIYRWVIIQTARLKMKNSKTVFIGIAGSYGKTAIANYLYRIFSKRYAVAMTDPRYTNDIGIARAILRNLSDDTEIFIVEIGTYKKGEIKNATYYIPFDYVILTGIGNHRFDLFGSKENMYEEFTSPLSKLSDNATVYMNAEIPSPKTNARIVTYDFSEHADIHPSQYTFSQTYTKARIHYKKHSWNITTALLGKHSLQNILPVFALCIDLGIKPADVIHELQELKHDKGSFSVHRGLHKSVIIVDTQESNLNGLLLKLDFLKHFPQKRKCIVTPGIRELGGEKRGAYESLVDKIAKFNMELYTTDFF